jgi:hypothetical protein
VEFVSNVSERLSLSPTSGADRGFTLRRPWYPAMVTVKHMTELHEEEPITSNMNPDDQPTVSHAARVRTGHNWPSESAHRSPRGQGWKTALFINIVCEHNTDYINH